MTASEPQARNSDILISADSHVIEPPELLAERVPSALRSRAPVFPLLKVGEGFQTHPGGSDPHERIKEMKADGVSAEVLYPTHLLPHFAMHDAELQHACFRAYNDWMIEYCRVAPERLIGIAAVSVYDIDRAVNELERCVKAGLKGSIVWQAPHPDLPFRSSHYDKFWAASQHLNAPVNLHILTGHGYHAKPGYYDNKGVEHYRDTVNVKLKEITDAMFDLVFYGVLDRYPGLRIVSVENEIGWMPFVFQQWDYYYRRFRDVNPPPMSKAPGEYLQRQIFATFFRDAVAGKSFQWWGQDNCMWSNDYPHANSTWPNSRKVIEQTLGELAPETRRKLCSGNVAGLFGVDMAKIAHAA